MKRMGDFGSLDFSKRHCLVVVIQAIIEAELSQKLRAGYYKRKEDRTCYRNGYRDRQDLSTGLGPVSLSIPKLRKGSFYPSILEQYQRVDRALISIVSEAYIAGQLRQRCIVHWMRNAQSKVSKTDLLWLLPLLKDLVGSRTRESFELAWNELFRVVDAKGKEKLRDWLDSTYHDITVYLDFPSAHWSRIKCTNSLERLNEELRRREKCIRIFPDEKSCFRMMGAILQGYSEDWTSGKLYLSEPLDKIRENRSKPIPFGSTRDGLKPCSVGYASSAGLQPVAAR